MRKVNLTRIRRRDLEKELERRNSIEYQRRVGREIRAKRKLAAEGVNLKANPDA